MNNFLKTYKDALAVVGMLVCILQTNVMFGSQPSEKKTVEVGSSDALAEAREKLLARDRTAAIKILVNEIEKQPEKQSAKAKAEIDKISELFLSNEGQKHFELAESIRFSGGSGFLPEYEMALKEEPGLWKVIINLIVIHLSENRCDSANALMTAAQEANPFKIENDILSKRIMLCLNKPEDFGNDESESQERKQKKSTDINIKAPTPVGALSAIGKAGLAQEQFMRKQMQMALRTANEIIQMDSSYPMGYYWAWRILNAEKETGLKEGRTYVDICKSISPTLRRKYYLEPQLCQEVDVVEDQIRKAEVSSN